MTQTYTHSPRPIGSPITFTIKGDRLIVDMGTGVSRVEMAGGGRVNALLKSNPSASKGSSGSPNEPASKGKSGPLGLMPGR